MSITRKVCFAGLTTMILLGMLELSSATLLLIRSGSHGQSNSELKRRFQPLRYELAAGMTEHLAFGPVARINDHGMRGSDVTTPKERIRILCIGDSCTFGFSPDVTDEKTYPAILGQRLDRLSPRTFDVVNGGMPNYCLLDCMNLFLYKGIELSPDYVVIMCGWNDSQHVHDLQRSYHVHGMVPRQDQLDWSSRVADSFAALKLAQRIRRRLVPDSVVQPAALTRQEILNKLSELAPASDAISEQSLVRFSRILRSFVGLARDQDVLPILVTLPHFTLPTWKGRESLGEHELRLMRYYLTVWNLSPKGWHTFVVRTNDAVRRVAKQENCPLIDGATVSGLKLFNDTCHLNAEGNSALAELVAREVMQHHTHRTTGEKALPN